ncbi:MAG: hypothetical protein AAFY66_01455 [Pseudomonadota bacterium]
MSITVEATRRPGSVVGTRLLHLGFALAPAVAGAAFVVLETRLVSALVWHEPAYAPEALILAFGLCIALSSLRYPTSAGAARLILVGLAIALALYGMALGTTLASQDASLAESLRHRLNLGWLLLLPAAGLSFIRPSFALFPCIYVAVHKGLSRSVSGAHELGVNDYLPLVEIGLFLSAALLASAALSSFLRRREDRLAAPEVVERDAAHLILAVAIGAHLGNYFLSGMAKISLDGGPLSWALENPTSALMLAGYNLGTAPLSLWPESFATAYQAFRAIEIPLNVVVLAAQVLCFVAFLHRRLTIGLAAFFDLMHIAIFILTGALFVPWILLNSLIVAAVSRERRGWSHTATAVGIIVAIFGHGIFYNARLGWYDSPQIRHAYFVALTEDGREVPVPSNAFRDASYLMLARHFGYREYQNPSAHVPTSAWGQIGIGVAPPAESGLDNRSTMRLTRECAYPLDLSIGQPDYDEARAAAFMQGQHRRALNLRAEGGIGDDWYPHHHFSMPGRFTDYATLSLEDITAYRYVVETVCMTVEDGQVVRRVMARTESDDIAVDTAIRYPRAQSQRAGAETPSAAGGAPRHEDGSGGGRSRHHNATTEI